jgi:L-seryl-tRNA(Ser) seleniumtransferase
MNRPPSVERLLQALAAVAADDLPRRELQLQQARDLLARLRRDPQLPRDLPTLAAQLHRELLAQQQPSLRALINASGVILQTNLGRAPLSSAAIAAMQSVAAGYSNLEYDLSAGERGSRTTHLNALLCRLTGAEAALVVNNNAAAIYLALIALAAGREVIVSRGQALEIGGGFRIPDVLRQSGAILVEVGTTNRTYLRDYAEAITERTALLLRVHSSNFRLVGFVHEPDPAELAALARERGIALLDDQGSGTLIDPAEFGLAAEPTLSSTLAAGADLVSASGDKLLGGPQAGLLLGRADLIARLRNHPLARALRVDKSTIAALQATLLSYQRGRALQEVPVWQMISTPLSALQARAAALQQQLAGRVSVVATESTVGGGSLPGATQPSVALALPPLGRSVDRVAAELRALPLPLVSRLQDGRLLCDLRSVLPEQDADLAAALQTVLS